MIDWNLSGFVDDMKERGFNMEALCASSSPKMKSECGKYSRRMSLKRSTSASRASFEAWRRHLMIRKKGCQILLRGTSSLDSWNSNQKRLCFSCNDPWTWLDRNLNEQLENNYARSQDFPEVLGNNPTVDFFLSSPFPYIESFEVGHPFRMPTYFIQGVL